MALFPEKFPPCPRAAISKWALRPPSLFNPVGLMNASSLWPRDTESQRRVPLCSHLPPCRQGPTDIPVNPRSPPLTWALALTSSRATWRLSLVGQHTYSNSRDPSILKVMVMILQSRQFSELLVEDTGDSTTSLFPRVPEVALKRVQILEVRARNCKLSCTEYISKPRSNT